MTKKHNIQSSNIIDNAVPLSAVDLFATGKPEIEALKPIPLNSINLWTGKKNISNSDKKPKFVDASWTIGQSVDRGDGANDNSVADNSVETEKPVDSELPSPIVAPESIDSVAPAAEAPETQEEKVDSLILTGERGSVEIARGQLWSLISDVTNQLDDYLIEEIGNAGDDKIIIKFTDRQPETRTQKAWAEIFSAGELQPEIQEGDNVADPGLVSGIVYENGRAVPEKSNIPQVEVPETEVEEIPDEVVEADQEIVQAVEALVPQAKAADQADTVAEQGGGVGGDSGQVPTTTNYKGFIQGNSDQLSADEAAQLEAEIGN